MRYPKGVVIQCSNCGKHETVWMTSSWSNLAKELYKKGYRYNGVIYFPECVKTWKERNGQEFDEQYRYMCKEFAEHLKCMYKWQHEDCSDE